MSSQSQLANHAPTSVQQDVPHHNNKSSQLQLASFIVLNMSMTEDGVGNSNLRGMTCA
jgi:hypothetical protein